MNFILAALVLIFSTTAHSKQQMSFQQELAVERLTTAVENKNYSEITNQATILKRSGLKLQGDLLYYEALGFFGVGQNGIAVRKADDYIKANGREAKFYRDALKLKGQAQDELELNVIANSRINFTRSNLEFASRTSRNTTGANKRLLDMTAFELSVADNVYKNNGDGTISVYSVIKSGNAELYDIVRIDWMACPIGTSYNPDADEVCSGKATEFRPAQIAPFLKSFNYARHSDWRLPTPGIYNASKIGFLHFVDLPGTSFAENHYAALGFRVPHVTPQQFLLNRDKMLELDMKLNRLWRPEYKWNHMPVFQQISGSAPNNFCATSTYHEIGATCGHPQLTGPGVVVPIRGPFLVETGLSGKCRYSRDYNLRVAPEVCELDSKPGQVFKKTFEGDLRGVSFVKE